MEIAASPSLFPGCRKAQAVDEVFDFVVGATDYGDRDGVAMGEHGQRGLVHDAAAAVFVEVSADESFWADGDCVRVFVGDEALGFGDFGEWEEILGCIF